MDVHGAGCGCSVRSGHVWEICDTVAASLQRGWRWPRAWHAISRAAGSYLRVQTSSECGSELPLGHEERERAWWSVGVGRHRGYIRDDGYSWGGGRVRITPPQRAMGRGHIWKGMHGRECVEGNVWKGCMEGMYGRGRAAE
eukprot:gene12674-biopygen2632